MDDAIKAHVSSMKITSDLISVITIKIRWLKPQVHIHRIIIFQQISILPIFGTSACCIKVLNFEKNGIDYVIIPIVSTQIFIPADSMFVVLKKS